MMVSTMLLKEKKGDNRFWIFIQSDKPLARLIRTVLAIAFWIAVWLIVASLANRNLLLKIPLPGEVLTTLFDDLKLQEFWKAVGTSVLHIVIGYICALAVGFAGGMISGISGWFRSFSMPLMHMIRAIPVAAFVILAWLWVPNSVLPSVIAFLMVLPIVWGHVDAALLAIDNHFIDLSKMDGANRIQTAFFVQLPMIHDPLRTGCLNGFGIAWKAGVAAEVICNPTGTIGSLLQKAKTGIDYPQVFAVTVAIVLVSVALEQLLRLIWRPVLT
ncbi:MAG: ABC transporter permease subunit [Clostridia bacterium]|nr:ABC transporter permease subunit [Clostridia bacterium]